MEIFHQITLILAAAAGMVFLCHIIRIPSVVAFLITGVVIGPHALGWVKSAHDVELVAEIGVVLLLFGIGLEFSLKNLWEMRKAVFGGGAAQVVLTAGLVAGAATLWGIAPQGAVFMGLLACLSSTAIVLRLIQDRGEMEAPYGKTSVSILLFQDLAVVVMVLLVPVLGGQGGGGGWGWELPLAAAEGLVLVGLVWVLASKAVPKLLHAVAKTGSQELFGITVIVICFTVAWLTYRAGLSLALGAFLAGMVISESEYSHQAVVHVLPLRDVFAGFFFISMGMLVNPLFLVANLGAVVPLAFALMLAKAAIIWIIGMFLGLSFRSAFFTGLALCQVGEFSFVLFGAGDGLGLVPEGFFSFFIAVAVCTMLVTPFALAGAPRLFDLVTNLPMPAAWKKRLVNARASSAAPDQANLSDHMIIVGYGLVGQHLAQAAQTWKIPYTVVEMNPETVAREKKAGQPIFFGDASQPAVLSHAAVDSARVLAVAVPDLIYIRRIIAVAKQINPRVFVIARSRYYSEYQDLMDLGADEVVTEEYETSVEIFSRVMGRYAVPRSQIDSFVEEVRSDGYEMFRMLPDQQVDLCRVLMPDVHVRRFKIAPGAPAAGGTPQGLELRKKHRVTVLSVRKGGKVLSSPGADTPLDVGDVILAVGLGEDLDAARKLFG